VTDAPLPRVVLKPRKAAPFFGRHPWVLDSAVDYVDGAVTDGQVVDLTAENGHWIARGIFNGHSRIRVRLYTWQKEQALDLDFWRSRMVAALELRRLAGFDKADAARLIFSEADGLSGLIVDRFGQYLSVQPTALSMAQQIDQLAPLLAELTGAQGVIVRAEPSMAKLEGFQLAPSLACGTAPPETMTIDEHGIRYGVQLLLGQKTGFYLDQRDNRRAAAAYFAGCNVLDVCCYTGGFSLCASKLGHATSVLGIDTSNHAVELATANARLNELDNVRFEAGEAFETLDALGRRGEKFGAIVLDPPKFARGRKGVDEALRAYHRLNQQAVHLLSPGGILVTCSCSGGVMPEDLQSMLLGVAMKTKRDIQILEQRGASADHPVSVTCAENAYLKCFICRVS
jgi:23S rRNA (cytosine1962-C5)-methyltransferase